MKTVAACDPSEENRQARAAEFGIDETYADLAEMIAQARLDAAVVCTPTPVRRQVLAPLLKAGIPVFCEKPFAETYAEACELEQLARDCGTPLNVDQNFRRHFTFDVARDILDRAELGRPLHLSQCAAYLRHDAGWRLDCDRYVMAVMSVHWFDGYRYMLREEPESVYCRTINSPATEGKDDTATSAILQFPSGCVVSLSESFSTLKVKLTAP